MHENESANIDNATNKNITVKQKDNDKPTKSSNHRSVQDD